MMRIFVLLAMFFGATLPATAQELCETSTGIPGTLYVNQFGFISGPETAERVLASDESLEFAFKTPTRFGYLVLPNEKGAVTVSFLTEGAETQNCVVQVRAFDGAKDDLAALASGDCDWHSDRNWPMLTGFARLFQVDPFDSVAVSDTSVADLAALTDRSLYVLGKGAGIANIVTLDAGGAVVSLCPMVVNAAEPFLAAQVYDSRVYCRDASGRLAQLSVGQSLVIAFDEDVAEWAVAESSIADTQAIDARSFKIDALAPGVTNIMGFSDTQDLLNACVVRVE